jgi:pyruvate/2-oxoglutarate dehydrogenase complex dihydrolipoamide dehydrogenase (E3) component
MMAVGRSPLTDELKTSQVGINLDKTTKKIVAEFEQTNVPHIFAVGDVLQVC